MTDLISADCAGIVRAIQHVLAGRVLYGMPYDPDMCICVQKANERRSEQMANRSLFSMRYVFCSPLVDQLVYSLTLFLSMPLLLNST
jgi:hypothetical protein